MKDINVMFKNLNYSISKIREFSDKPIWLVTMCYISDFTPFGSNEFRINTKAYSFYEMVKMFELNIYKTAKKYSNVYILNFDSIFEKYNKYECVKSYQAYPYGHLTYFGSGLVAETFYNQICYLEKSIKRVKCVVVDLDNTLWKGILIEDGFDKIKVDQKKCNALYGLAKRGIVLALCSKNEPTLKDGIFNKLKKDLYGQHIVKYICSWRINWSPKSENIRSIANELNIGLDTVALFDDSEFERREVEENASDVLVYTDKDLFRILLDPKFMPHGGLINKTTGKRLDTYIKNKDRNIELKKFEDDTDSDSNPFEKFMVNSQFELDIHLAEEAELNRIFELIQRTNQMNATLERTDMNKIREYHSSDICFIYSINLKDKFGDYGNVGTVIVETLDDKATILEFAISCRAMGKRVEDMVIITLFNELENMLIKSIDIKLIETLKNKSFIKIFKQFDFTEQSDSTYTHILNDKIYEIPLWFK